MFGLIQLFLLIIVCIFHGVVHEVRSQEYYYCYGELVCPTGFEIRYPFWRADNKTAEKSQGYFCGYPGFSISCGGGRPVISISNHNYYVQNMDYSQRKMRVVDVDIDGHDCPQPRHNLSEESTPFYHSYSSTAVLYTNCSNVTVEYPEDMKQQIIPCLDHVDVQGNQTRHSFLFDTDFNYDNGNWSLIIGGGEFNWYENCQDAVEIRYPPYSEYKQSWKLGFDLRWGTRADSKKCEKSGGKSFFNETTREFHCFCPHEGLHESVCPVNRMSITRFCYNNCTHVSPLRIMTLERGRERKKVVNRRKECESNSLELCLYYLHNSCVGNSTTNNGKRQQG